MPRRAWPSAPAPRSCSALRAGDAPVYGVNTGFGKLASTRIDADRPRPAAAQPDPLAQRRRRRAAGGTGGAPDARAEGGVARARRTRACAKRWSTRCSPCTTPASCRSCRRQGSVGASGDLAPLAHMTLALIGEGEFMVDGERRAAARRAARGRHRAARARRPRKASR